MRERYRKAVGYLKGLYTGFRRFCEAVEISPKELLAWYSEILTKIDEAGDLFQSDVAADNEVAEAVYHRFCQVGPGRPTVQSRRATWSSGSRSPPRPVCGRGLSSGDQGPLVLDDLVVRSKRMPGPYAGGDRRRPHLDGLGAVGPGADPRRCSPLDEVQVQAAVRKKIF